MEINKELLLKAVDSGLVTVKKHPTEELYIYNYSASVQYDKLWDEITLQTRGLILDDKYNIVAKPFGKFFNIEELNAGEIPNLPFEVFDKMDGSLGILYWVKGVPYIATRGSFDSDQAVHATNILHKKYFNLLNQLDINSTYLFEIIYPENRIVVDYKDYDDIVLLTVIDNITGDERMEYIGFPTVLRYDGITDLDKIRDNEEENKEGFVVRFANGFRVKLKYKEYVRLHKIFSGLSNIAIWEYLKEGKPLNELLDVVPDEVFDWVETTQDKLVCNFNEIYNECKNNFKILDTRKETALYFSKQKYPSVLFALLDDKDVNSMIWKMVRPKFSKSLKTF